MRRMTIAAGFFALCSGPALAAGDVMAGYYGNTVISSGSMYEARTHYRADHTFDVTFSAMAMSKSFKGTWTIDAGGQFCRTYVGEIPPGSRPTLCRAFAAHKVGDTWSITTNGDTRTYSLNAGIQ